MFISYLNYTNIRPIEASKLWFFYKQLFHFNDCLKEVLFYAPEEYFENWQKLSPHRLEFHSFPGKFGYQVPNFDTIQNCQKIIPENIRPQFTDSCYSTVNHQHGCQELYDICRKYKPKFILAIQNDYSLNILSQTLNIPIIYNELGNLRPPFFKNTMCFDFQGINANTGFDKIYEDQKQSKDGLKYIYSLEDLIRIISNNEISKQTLLNILNNKEYKYNYGIAGQCEEDSNILGFSNNHSTIDLINHAYMNTRNWNKIVFREHPSSMFQLKDSVKHINRSKHVDSIKFIDNCKKIISINSSTNVEAMLLGRESLSFGESPFKNMYNENGCLNLQKFTYYILAYLAPYNLMYDLDYINFRLNTKDLNKILEYHLQHYKNMV
jgi:hypothetical protein